MRVGAGKLAHIRSIRSIAEKHAGEEAYRRSTIAKTSASRAAAAGEDVCGIEHPRQRIMHDVAIKAALSLSGDLDTGFRMKSPNCPRLSEAVADAGVGADVGGSPGGSILRRRLATWARRTWQFVRVLGSPDLDEAGRDASSACRGCAPSAPQQAELRSASRWTSARRRGSTLCERRGRSRGRRRRSAARLPSGLERGASRPAARAMSSGRARRAW